MKYPKHCPKCNSSRVVINIIEIEDKIIYSLKCKKCGYTHKKVERK